MYLLRSLERLSPETITSLYATLDEWQLTTYGSFVLSTGEIVIALACDEGDMLDVKAEFELEITESIETELEKQPVTS